MKPPICVGSLSTNILFSTRRKMNISHCNVKFYYCSSLSMNSKMSLNSLCFVDNFTLKKLSTPHKRQPRARERVGAQIKLPLIRNKFKHKSINKALEAGRGRARLQAWTAQPATHAAPPNNHADCDSLRTSPTLPNSPIIPIFYCIKGKT